MRKGITGVLLALALTIGAGSRAQYDRDYFYYVGRSFMIDNNFEDAIRTLNILLRFDDDAYEGYFPLVCALKLAPLVFTRPTELRAAQWKEFDLESGEWRIPAERMKMRRQHLVPLSRQAMFILRELQKYSGEGKFLFPSIRTEVRPISDATMLNALRRMGYQKHEMSVHGFRSIASTLLNELGYNRDWIERQLAHGEQDEVRAAYNYAEYLPERRKMMQDWADYLDGLRNTQQKRNKEGVCKRTP